MCPKIITSFIAAREGGLDRLCLCDVTVNFHNEIHLNCIDMVILVSSIPRADDGDCDHVYPGTVTSMCSVAGVRHVRHHRVLELSDQRRRRCPPPPPLFKFYLVLLWIWSKAPEILAC